MFSPNGAKTGARRGGASPAGSGAGVCARVRVCVMALTLAAALLILYAYMYVSLRRKGPQEQCACDNVVTPPCAATGSAPHVPASVLSLARAQGDTRTLAVREGDPTDPDAWLDSVGDHPPPIVPSHYASVWGQEPFERASTDSQRPFELHVHPTDEWYELAKRATDRCDLELTSQAERWPGVGNGLEDKVVWVSGLFDLNRGDAGMKEFHRPREEYFRRFNLILDRGFQMVIFIPKEFEEHLHIDRSRIHVIYMTMAQLRAYFPYYDRVQSIRTSKLWTQQAVLTGWLSNAPQARLADYDPLVMSKLMLLKDAARLNPWGSRYHLWMDAGHLCAPDQRPDATSLYREHMSQGFFVTHWPYETNTEVHGMTDNAMHMYMAQAEDPLRIVRGGIFGGTLPYIECVLKAYMLALHQTLMDGYLGTEECIWAMIHRRLPHLFKSFDNNSLGGFGDNCASFTANNMYEEEVSSGKRKRFVSPPIPGVPSWWDEAQKMAGGVRGAADKNVKALLKVGGVGLKGKAQ